MLKRLHFIWLTLLQAGLVTLWLASGAAADCAGFGPLKAVTLEVRMIATGRAPVDAAAARRLAQAARRADLDEVTAIKRQLTGMGLSHEINHFVQLANFAAELSTSKRVPDQAALMRNVQQVERLLKKICGAKPLSGALDPNEPESWKNRLSSILESDRTSLKVSLPLILLFGLIGLVFGLKTVIQYGIGLIHHKKVCRVPAQLHGDGQIFPGVVTRAGLNGVRFELKSAVAVTGLTTLLANPRFIRFNLWIDGEIWPVFVDGYQRYFSPLYFEPRINRRDLKMILEQSTRKIQPAPSIGHKSTRRKWRAHILKRRSEIGK